ncbi:hypothetical protein FOZ63_010887 [Perkinsus olseni]|uniref:Uncharacterized protein n=1 Tax=Perkinsus olseni TaxID=32597 RepID=A0A7J6UH25_PEROL|nr:hypothetical protein FOZ63_010887 [Perkinsus olseni]
MVINRLSLAAMQPEILTVKATSSQVVDNVAKQLEASSSRALLYNHYATLQTQRIHNGQRSIHVVVHTMSRPVLRASVEQLPTELQWSFYEQLDQHLNIERTDLDDVDILRILRDVKEAQQEPVGGVDVGGSVPTTEAAVGSTPPDEGGVHNQEASSLIGEEDDCSEGSYSDVPRFDWEEGSDEDAESTDSELENALLSPRGSAAARLGPGRDRFEEEPFLICRGPLHKVVEDFLTEQPHYRLTRTTIERLKEVGRSCILECERTISYKNKGKPLIAGMYLWKRRCQ